MILLLLWHERGDGGFRQPRMQQRSLLHPLVKHSPICVQSAIALRFPMTAAVLSSHTAGFAGAADLVFGP